MKEGTEKAILKDLVKAWDACSGCPDTSSERRTLSEIVIRAKLLLSKKVSNVDPVSPGESVNYWSVSTDESDGFMWLHLLSSAGHVATLRCKARQHNGDKSLTAQAVVSFAQDFNTPGQTPTEPIASKAPIPAPLAPQPRPFTDLSTASPKSKALLFLEQLAQGSEKYFYEDGFPRSNIIAKDARAAQEFIELADKREAKMLHGLSVKLEQELVSSHARMKKIIQDWRKE